MLLAQTVSLQHAASGLQSLLQERVFTARGAQRMIMASFMMETDNTDTN